MSRNSQGTVAALVPARGGSKGISRKNVVEVAGKPLIAWTIEAALRSSVLDRVVVSTDDEEIARVSKEWGAEVPFYRPAELSRDDSPSIAAVNHALRWLEENQNYRPEALLLLQPTSPLRTAEDVRNAVHLLFERNASAVVSVYQPHTHPCWFKKITKDGYLSNFLEGAVEHVRRQDLPPAYALNGSIFLARREILLHEETFYPDRTCAYIMPEERSLDIDSPADLRLANFLLAHEGH